jgi:hypothetical protein
MEANQFSNNTKKMRLFLIKLYDKIKILEKHFDDDQKRTAALNDFFYEYEVNSYLTYTTETNDQLEEILNTEQRHTRKESVIQ